MTRKVISLAMCAAPTSFISAMPGYPPICSTSSRWKAARNELLLDGKADVTFASGSQEKACERLGLHTRLLPRYPMVNSITLTSLVPLVQDNPELYIRMIKAIATGVAMVKRDKEKTMEILAGNVADRLGIRDDIELESFYQKLSNSLSPGCAPRSTRFTTLTASLSWSIRN